MNTFWNVLLNALAVVAQFGAQFSDYVPQASKMWVALAIGIIQAIIAWKAHYLTPNGDKIDSIY